MTRREYEYLIGGTMNRKYKLKNITADMDEKVFRAAVVAYTIG
jgi:hypothetical protein